jgi:hypothetical protein
MILEGKLGCIWTWHIQVGGGGGVYRCGRTHIGGRIWAGGGMHK